MITIFDDIVVRCDAATWAVLRLAGAQAVGGYRLEWREEMVWNGVGSPMLDTADVFFEVTCEINGMKQRISQLLRLERNCLGSAVVCLKQQIERAVIEIASEGVWKTFAAPPQPAKQEALSSQSWRATWPPEKRLSEREFDKYYYADPNRSAGAPPP